MTSVPFDISHCFAVRYREESEGGPEARNEPSSEVNQKLLITSFCGDRLRVMSSVRIAHSPAPIAATGGYTQAAVWSPGSATGISELRKGSMFTAAVAAAGTHTLTQPDS